MSWRRIAAALAIPVMTAVDAYRMIPDRTENVPTSTESRDRIASTSAALIGAYANDRERTGREVRV